jgi:hypothetical protein
MAYPPARSRPSTAAARIRIPGYARCTPCDDVANAAVNLACTILSEALPTSSQELTDAATVIVNSLMISTNIWEPACDIGAGIQAAIDVKLNQ